MGHQAHPKCGLVSELQGELHVKELKFSGCLNDNVENDLIITDYWGEVDI